MLKFIEQHSVFSTAITTAFILLIATALPINSQDIAAEESNVDCSLEVSQQDSIEQVIERSESDTTAVSWSTRNTSLQMLAVGKEKLAVVRSSNCFWVFSKDRQAADAFQGVMKKYTPK